MSHRVVQGTGIFALGAALVLAGCGDTEPAGGATTAPASQWLTAWGQPDLQGTWSSDDARGIPLQRPEQFGTRTELSDEEFAERQKQNDTELGRLAAGGTAFLSERGVRTLRQTSLVVDPPDGRVPALTPEAQQLTDAQTKRRGTRPASWEDRSLYDRCISRGVVGSILPVIYGNGLEIVQSPDSVAIRYEMIHETRIVPLDGRPHVAQDIRTYMGDPRGHWEGDTLVIETTNFLGLTGIGLNGNGPPTTTATKLTERFRRVADDRIDYEVTVEDPNTYTAPFKIAFPITPQPDYQVLPYECHEGNRALSNILSAARNEERLIAEARTRGLPEPKFDDSQWRDPGRGERGDVYSAPRE
jgi:hypothetical protein